MEQFIFGIIGVVFIGVMFDILYPNGKTNGFCKSIFSILSLFIILKPIFNIKDLNLNFDYKIDETFSENISDARIDSLEVRIENHLTNVGIKEVDVEIDGIVENFDILVENVYIDISSLVLSENMANINKYEVILDEITKIVDVEKEKVFIYG